MARGYSVANYGDGYFGTTKYVDAVAAGAASASLSSSGTRIKLGASAIAPALSLTANATYTVNASATVNGQVAIGTQGVRIQFVTSIVETSSTTVSSAERIRFGDGSTISATSSLSNPTPIVTFGGSADIPCSSSVTANCERIFLGVATSSPSASVTSSGLIVKDGSGSLSSSSSVSSVGQITANGLAYAIAPILSISANGQSILVGAASSSASLSPTMAGTRVRLASSIKASESSLMAIGRRKWETIAVNSVNWTQIAA